MSRFDFQSSNGFKYIPVNYYGHLYGRKIAFGLVGYQ